MIIRCIILLCMIGGMAMICGTFGYYDLKLGCWLLNHIRAVIRIINRELFRQEGGDHK
jgi:hypothetical protein